MPDSREQTPLADAENNAVLSEEEELLLKQVAGFTDEDRVEMNQTMMGRAALALSEKYGETFIPTLIGDRMNQGRAKVFLHPEKEEALVFTAFVSFEGEVRDDYVSASLLYRVETELEKLLADAGIPAAANCVLPVSVTDESDTSLSLEAFARKHNIRRILCRLVFPEGTSRDAVFPALEEYSRDCPVDIMINGFMLNRESFEKCKKNFALYPSATEDMIRGFGPAEEFRLFVSGGSGTWMSE